MEKTVVTNPVLWVLATVSIFAVLVGGLFFLNPLYPSVALATNGGGQKEQKDNEKGDGEKITICHATSSEGNPWTRIVVSDSATGGHFKNNGTPKAGHEGDLLLEGDVECPLNNNTEDEDDGPALVRVKICKIVLDEDGNVFDGEGFSGTFRIRGLDFNLPAGVIPTTVFSTPLSFTHDLLFNDGVNEAMCAVYDNVPVGNYYYEEEIVTGHDAWMTPLYNDNVIPSSTGLNDFYEYSDELFNEDVSDDENRNHASDGHVLLTADHNPRIIAVLNRLASGGGGGENQKPVITLLGDNPLIFQIGDLYEDPGATAEDSEDGDITEDIVVNFEDIDTSEENTFIITYNVVDSNGLAADEVTRTVIIEDGDGGGGGGGGGGGETPLCSDAIDNDGDGDIDIDDAACHTDNDSENPDSYDPNINDENEKPVITLIGDSTIEVIVGGSFTDPGATAEDPEDGDITSDVVVGGDSVDTNTLGSYVITYNVTDSLGLAALEITRIVTVVAEDEEETPTPTPTTIPTPSVTSSSGGGGGGGGPITNTLRIFNEKIQIISEGTAVITWETNKPATSQVFYDNIPHLASASALNFGSFDSNLGYNFSSEKNAASTQKHSVVVNNVDLENIFYFRPISEDTTRAIGTELSAVLGKITSQACGQYLNEFIRFNTNNNPDEVRKLQTFLNDFEGFNLSVTGIYDLATFEAVKAFQNKYGSDVLSPWGLQGDTGFVYLTTRKKINELYCNNQLPFPLNPDQQAEVNSFRSLIESLRESGQPLPDTSDVGLDETPAGSGLVEEDSTPATGIAGEEKDDSLAAAIRATEGGVAEGVLERTIRGVRNFVRNLFSRDRDRTEENGVGDNNE